MLIGATLFSGVFFAKAFTKDQTVEEVLETARAKYDMQGYIIGEEPATIDVDLYNEDDVEKVEKYIEKNLSDEDLEKYTIRVFSEWTVNN